MTHEDPTVLRNVENEVHGWLRVCESSVVHSVRCAMEQVEEPQRRLEVFTEEAAARFTIAFHFAESMLRSVHGERAAAEGNKREIIINAEMETNLGSTLIQKRESIALASMELEQTQRLLQANREELQTMDEKLKEKQLQLEALEKDIFALKLKHENEKQAFSHSSMQSSKVAAPADSLDERLNDSVREKEKQLLLLRDEISTNEKHLTGVKESADHVKAELEKNEELLATSLARLEEVNAQIHCQHELLTEKQQECAEMKEVKNECQAEHSEVCEDLKAKKAMLNKLQVQLDTLQMKQSVLSDSFTAKEGEVGVLEVSKSILQDRIKSLEEQKQRLQADCDELRVLRNELESSLEHTRQAAIVKPQTRQKSIGNGPHRYPSGSVSPPSERSPSNTQPHCGKESLDLEPGEGRRSPATESNDPTKQVDIYPESASLPPPLYQRMIPELPLFPATAALLSVQEQLHSIREVSQSGAVRTPRSPVPHFQVQPSSGGTQRYRPYARQGYSTSPTPPPAEDTVSTQKLLTRTSMVPLSGTFTPSDSVGKSLLEELRRIRQLSNMRAIAAMVHQSVEEQ